MIKNQFSFRSTSLSALTRSTESPQQMIVPSDSMTSVRASVIYEYQDDIIISNNIVGCHGRARLETFILYPNLVRRSFPDRQACHRSQQTMHRRQMAWTRWHQNPPRSTGDSRSSR